ncbi:DUF6232 family protein [Streptomyces sp. NPDC059740]|uniref:DUF6232 family protein n=1 Tax=Streptomyces sp. NPDC059740 TaxID=3346926 RepID=UPI0036538709
MPPAGAEGYPDVPAPAAELHGSVEMRISKRLLWVGDAAYPLHNIARIHTFTLLPRRQEAVTRFLKRVGLTLPALFFTTLMVGLATLTSDSGDTFLTLIWLVGVAALIYYLADLIIVLMAPSHYVLAVETSGPSTAVVTSQNPGHLRQLAQYLANALENPDTEFHVQVETITFNPQNYYFGDSVNMYGGSGNTGMAKG